MKRIRKPVWQLLMQQAANISKCLRKFQLSLARGLWLYQMLEKVLCRLTFEHAQRCAAYFLWPTLRESVVLESVKRQPWANFATLSNRPPPLKRRLVEQRCWWSAHKNSSLNYLFFSASYIHCPYNYT